MCVRLRLSQFRSVCGLSHAVSGLLLLLSMGWAQAHEVRPAVVTLDVQEDGSFSMGIDLNLEALLAGLTATQGEQHQDKDADGKTDERVQEYERLRALSPAELEAVFREQQTVFLKAIRVKAEARCVALQLEAVTIPEISVLPVARNSLLLLRGQFPEKPSSAWTWRWAPRFGAAILRVNVGEQEVYTDYLEAGMQSPVITLP